MQRSKSLSHRSRDILAKSDPARVEQKTFEYMPVAAYRFCAMKLRELKNVLRTNPERHLRFLLPDGDTIPAHFHVTEVGHVAKRFIDCGGKLHDTSDTCLLQTYVADDADHRLTGRVLAKILDLGQQVLPHDELEVEIEYDCCVVSQYSITGANVTASHIDFALGAKKTDCLAKDRCGLEEGGCGCAEQKEAAIACC